MKIGERILAERSKKGLDIECVIKAIFIEFDVLPRLKLVGFFG